MADPRPLDHWNPDDHTRRELRTWRRSWRGMTDYRATTTEITLHPVEVDPLSYKATRVQLAGTRDGGYFIQIEQEDQCIELDPEELPHLLEACEQLLRQQREANAP